MTTRRISCTAFAVALLIGTQAQAAGVSDKCEAAKNKIAGKYALCRQKAEAKAIKTGSAPDYSRCDSKQSQKWSAAESSGGGMCPTNGDQSTLQGCIASDTGVWAAALNGSAQCAPVHGLPQTAQSQCDDGTETFGACPGSPAGQDGAVRAGVPRSFRDNGDGTIMDNVTGLMWEKLADDGSIHDQDDTYNWYDAFSIKIAGLNSGSGFAGHTDWRVPNELELELLLNLQRDVDEDPKIAFAFDSACAPNCTVTTCSCTQPTRYWTSTTTKTTLGTGDTAWNVGFSDTAVESDSKASTLHCVRAVRGGS
jgi:hypothetical protein